MSSTTVVACRLPVEDAEQLRRQAEHHGSNVSGVIAELIKAFGALERETTALSPAGELLAIGDERRERRPE